MSKSFTYSLVSDLHIDANHLKAADISPQLEEFVVVAGDTSNSVEQSAAFINKLKALGHRVFAVDGNHEHYSNYALGRTFWCTQARFYDAIKQPEGILQLDNGLTIIGLNSWYDPSNDLEFWANWMNDFRRAGSIGNIAKLSAIALDQKLQEVDKALIVTHTAPHPLLLKWMERNSEWNRSNAFFHNEHMADVLAKHADKIVAWNYGHTHFAGDQLLDDVRCICNPKGYPGENPDWQPITVTVEF